MSQETDDEWDMEGSDLEWDKDEESINQRRMELAKRRTEIAQLSDEITHMEQIQKQELENKQYGSGYYTIDRDVLEDIEEIIWTKTKRYPNWKKFVDESLKNMITFWQRPQEMVSISGKLWKDMTDEMKQEIKKNAPDFYYQMDENFGLHNKVATTVSGIHHARTKLSNVKFQKPENILYGYYNSEKDTYHTDVIHETYNRFFPLKLLVTTLASMINKTINVPGHTEWVSYEEFSKEALEFAQEISNKLKKIKSTAGRNERISTGLPIGYPHQTNPDKIKTSDVRFLKCFVGHKGATQVFAEKQIHRGALNETGLVYIREKNKKLEITLSKEGFKFYKMKNPIIDGIHDINEENGSFKFTTNDEDYVESKAFSNEEKNFIMKNIITKFPLEDKIVESIVSDMSDGKERNHHEIDDIITKKTGNGDEYDKLSKEVQDKIKAYRMATMGRLAEIGVVDWKIRKGNSGNAESFYLINTK